MHGSCAELGHHIGDLQILFTHFISTAGHLSQQNPLQVICQTCLLNQAVRKTIVWQVSLIATP